MVFHFARRAILRDIVYKCTQFDQKHRAAGSLPENSIAISENISDVSSNRLGGLVKDLTYIASSLTEIVISFKTGFG
jgi:uncharacterized protein YajQ (UPF0234 family)